MKKTEKKRAKQKLALKEVRILFLEDRVRHLSHQLDLVRQVLEGRLI